MNYAAVVAEMNPLHYGHLQILQEARQRADGVVVLLSGAFTQRGMPVVTDKFTRAKDILQNGGDLVLTHPVQTAIAHGEMFSYGAVSALAHVPGIRSICCGTEWGDTRTFEAIRLYTKTKDFRDRLKSSLNDGASYATAYRMALEEKNTAWRHLFQGNALLAFGYYRAIADQNLPISLIPIPRKEDGAFPTMHASEIRRIFGTNPARATKYCAATPPQFDEAALFSGLYLLYRAHFGADFDFSPYDGYEAGIEHRIVRLLRTETNAFRFLERASTRRYSKWRIARLLLSAYLDISKKETQTSVQNSRSLQVLGFNERGREILSFAKNGECRLLTNFKQLHDGDPDESLQLVWESKATDLWSVLTKAQMGEDYLRHPVITTYKK